MSMDLEKIEEVVSRGVSAILPSREALILDLKSGKKLKIYNGIDPTGKLHIGHMVVLKKLRAFQDLGHEVIVLIGDFTARIGDPTDKNAARKKLTKAEVDENSKNYKQLIGKILDTQKTDFKFLHNEEWSNILKPVDMLELASNFTVQQLIERDMFQERLKAGKEIYLHEFLYPIFQAYDAVTMEVDLQVGGNDQIFNMMAGRSLMRKLKNREKFVLAMKLLTDPQGKKMGKTEGNIISLDDSPEDVYGKIMSFPDELILIGFELLTDKSMEEISRLEKDLGSSLNPRDAKAELAFEVTSKLSSKDDAKRAQDHFDKVFRLKEAPSLIREIDAMKGIGLVDLLVKADFAPSNSAAKRLIEQGAIKIDSEIIKEDKVLTEQEFVLSAGKRNFVKVKLNA